MAKTTPAIQENKNNAQEIVSIKLFIITSFWSAFKPCGCRVFADSSYLLSLRYCKVAVI